jgi:predicted nuclease with RNAse H fold
MRIIPTAPASFTTILVDKRDSEEPSLRRQIRIFPLVLVLFKELSRHKLAENPQEIQLVDN